MSSNNAVDIRFRDHIVGSFWIADQHLVISTGWTLWQEPLGEVKTLVDGGAGWVILKGNQLVQWDTGKDDRAYIYVTRRVSGEVITETYGVVEGYNNEPDWVTE